MIRGMHARALAATAATMTQPATYWRLHSKIRRCQLRGCGLRSVPMDRRSDTAGLTSRLNELCYIFGRVRVDLRSNQLLLVELEDSCSLIRVLPCVRRECSDFRAGPCMCARTADDLWTGPCAGVRTVNCFGAGPSGGARTANCLEV